MQGYSTCPSPPTLTPEMDTAEEGRRSLASLGEDSGSWPELPTLGPMMEGQHFEASQPCKEQCTEGEDNK